MHVCECDVLIKRHKNINIYVLYVPKIDNVRNVAFV